MVSGFGVSVWFFQSGSRDQKAILVPCALALHHRLVQKIKVELQACPR